MSDYITHKLCLSITPCICKGNYVDLICRRHNCSTYTIHLVYGGVLIHLVYGGILIHPVYIPSLSNQVYEGYRCMDLISVHTHCLVKYALNYFIHYALIHLFA